MIISQKAYAKLNFNLHVLPERLPNGYHQVECLNFEANLADEITLTQIHKDIVLTCDDPNLACDESNLAYKAAQLVMQKYHPKGGIKIDLEKHIPVTGGLGGGSADAGAVINGLNKLWHLKLTNQQKIELGEKIGMDVCYSVLGGICKVSGAGEIVKPLNISFPGINLIIISPQDKKPSSAWAYQQLKPNHVGKNISKLDDLIKAIKNKNLQDVAKNLHNDFEEPIIKHFPIVAKIKAEMIKEGALGTNLSGAGLSVFGIWPDKKSAEKAFEKLKKIYPQTYLCQTI